MSRQFGALGGEVGRQVAQRLGFSFYGQELVDEIRYSLLNRLVQ